MQNFRKKAWKVVGNIIVVVCILFEIWIAASWMNVLAHNDPWRGDKKYAPNNIFVLIERLRND